MHWNDEEKLQAVDIVHRIESATLPRAAAIVTRNLVFAPDAAGALIDGLHRSPHWSSGISLGFLPLRHLYRLLSFDEMQPFRWRLEHKLVQSLVLNHYCPGVVPVTRGFSRYVAENREMPGRNENTWERLYVKTALGFGAKPQADGEVRLTAEDLSANLESKPRPCITAEDWIVQSRLPIIEEYRVHSIEDEVVEDLTFMRHSFDPIRQKRDGPNRFVKDVLSSLPNAFVSNTILGWDIARVAGGYRIVEINFSGFHPESPRGFQCSGFLAQPLWGPANVARLFRAVERKYGVVFSCADSEDAAPEVRVLYWWVSRWYELLRVCDSINHMTGCLQELNGDVTQSPRIWDAYGPCRDLLVTVAGRLHATTSLVD